MRQTLRRSCAACAKSKHSCDLRTPRCSRCIKRRVPCQYANEPLTGPQSPPRAWDSTTALTASTRTSNSGTGSLYDLNFASSPDPFDSYPKTRLPRDQVQRLIHAFLNKISFQYYPLDLTRTSNPFLISWWPLALGDPALFHVSLQTACLDAELIAQKGFHTSQMLMADSVALVRRKVQDPILGVQDGTLNSIVTLAAIEFGKGNGDVAEMHVDGLKRLVNMRGGISAVRQTSPLTARMVSWVTMLIMGKPQFDAQDDFGTGNGIPPPPEWQLDFTTAIHQEDLPQIFGVSLMDIESVDPQVRHIFIRLHNVFHRARTGHISNTLLHDLTCYVVHRLLLLHADSTVNNMSARHNEASAQSPIVLSSAASTAPSQLLIQSHQKPILPGASYPSQISECIRYAMTIYMFIAQGPTYYSHHVILNTIMGKFTEHLEQLDMESLTETSNARETGKSHQHNQRRVLRDPLDTWLIAIGLVAATGTPRYQWFVDKGIENASSLLVRQGDMSGGDNNLTWEEDILPRIKKVLWLEKPKAEDVFRPHWEVIFGAANRSGCPNG